MGNLKEISEEFNILQNKFMGLENKHQEEMRLMKLEVNNIILAYNLQALDEKVSLKTFIYRFFYDFGTWPLIFLFSTTRLLLKDR